MGGIALLAGPAPSLVLTHRGDASLASGNRPDPPATHRQYPGRLRPGQPCTRCTAVDAVADAAVDAAAKNQGDNHAARPARPPRDHPLGLLRCHPGARADRQER
ncbi:hypothetical protein CBM2592_B40214 [Cupriavidus taiwanensis]|nr:hypothetical protein CBM2592_B40214 [Cupriavidus taiwanensis]SOY72077.1 hypothetical protein CBM2588_B40032 [Cupriavidus taiwanensis]SOY95641.1 hypothetical protein CBM2591_B20212 [Cupriavidus taiwanensis]SOZ29899.1 hypothetical protein CBM2608_B30240 [Cupriavidus taiwanensis]SOZ74751.1 hypothetical protein CBM2617_B60129 [Cupriavidus taiwanensis]